MPPPVLGAKLRGAERAHNGTLGQQSRYVPSKFSGFRYIAALLIGNTIPLRTLGQVLTLCHAGGIR